MTSKQTNTSTSIPTLLERLGKMTAIRDTHLLEQALLRTLAPLLGATDTSLFRVDDSHEIRRVIHYSRATEGENGDIERVTERVEEVLSDRDVLPEVHQLLDNVRLLGRPRNCKIGDKMITAYALHGNDQLRGYFVFEREREMTPVEDSVVRGVLEIFSNYFALLDTSQRDRLTGLHNRYSLELNLDRLWSVLSARMIESVPGTERRGTELHNYWLGVMDIDHFKKVNDTYGHIIGDEVLLVVARLLGQSFRRSDLLYRYGGEEFIAIIAANDLECAWHVFERARRTIEAYNFPQVGKVTISGGFASADPNVLPQTVINRADRSLYQAKADGRNRMHHYHTLISQGVLQEVHEGSIDLF